MKMRYLRNVSTVRLDRSACTGCGMCLHVCPREVLERDGRQVRIADSDACNECGACSRNCPTGAIFVKAGVGCAQAVIQGKIHNTGPECGCSSCCN